MGGLDKRHVPNISSALWVLFFKLSNTYLVFACFEMKLSQKHCAGLQTPVGSGHRSGIRDDAFPPTGF